jgi:GT2 family glycosyltransferase
VEKPAITVVVPTVLAPTPFYNRSEDLKRCLEALRRQTFKDFEVLIVDNSPIHTNVSVPCKTGLLIRVTKNPTRNLTRSFNLGWRDALAEVIAYINDDAEAEPTWLENIITTFKELDRASFVGGPTISTRVQEMLSLHMAAKRSILLKLFGRIYEKIALQGRLFDIGALCESGAYSIGGSLPFSANLEEPVEVDFLTITNMAVRKEVLENLGGFDENFSFTHADGDLFIRARKAGYKLIFNSKVVVWHHVNPSGSTRSAYYQGRDFAYFYFKSIRPRSFHGRLGYMLNILYFNAYWLYKALKSGNPSFLKGIRGFIDGFSHYLKAYPTYKMR